MHNNSILNIDSNNCLIGCDKSIEGILTIPEGVTSIDEFAFSKCSGLTSIIIPKGVASISRGAFSNCSGLTSITIPKGITCIGEYAFSGCKSLPLITIPKGVASIEGSAFADCEKLTSITIFEGITCIAFSTFSGCSSLTSITIPKSVTSIGKFAFEGCSGLTSIIIPEGVESIDEAVFSDCHGLTSIIIPNSITYFNLFRTSTTVPTLALINIPNKYFDFNFNKQDSGDVCIRELSLNYCEINPEASIEDINYSKFINTILALSPVFSKLPQEMIKHIKSFCKQVFLKGKESIKINTLKVAELTPEKDFNIQLAAYRKRNNEIELYNKARDLNIKNTRQLSLIN